MTIRLFLQQNGFNIEPNNYNQDFPTFFRYYDAILLAAIFNQMTGEFYAVRFESEEELQMHKAGEFNLVKALYRTDGAYLDKPAVSKYRPKIHILPIANLHGIDTKRDLYKAFECLEKMIDAELLGISHHVDFGDRVVATTITGNQVLGTVIDMDSTNITVRYEFGVLSFMAENVQRVELPFHIPGEWVEKI